MKVTFKETAPEQYDVFIDGKRLDYFDECIIIEGEQLVVYRG